VFGTYQKKFSQIRNTLRAVPKYSTVMPTVFGIASDTCSTCLDLHRLRARNEAALSHARKSYLAALRTADRGSLADLEEELKQTAAAETIIAHTIRTHQARQHTESRVGALAAA
jgi:hypothetical protein